jgi:hypothetical protein
MTGTKVVNPKVLQFKAHIKNGVIIPDKKIDIPADKTYWVTLEVETEPSESVDALAEIVAMAQPMGFDDLARNFDHHTNRVVADEPTD